MWVRRKDYTEITSKLQTVMEYLLNVEKALTKEQTLRERLELDLAASQSEYRKVVETLGQLAKRPNLDSMGLTDLFAEDPKQPDVWVSDPELSADEIFKKMTEEPAANG
jgi:hypothetical protein